MSRDRTDPRDIVLATIEELGPGPLMVHSDLLFAPRPGPRDARVPGQPGRLAAHAAVLAGAAGDRGLWVPAFNYWFTRTGTFDVRTDGSEVGQLSEYIRRHVAAWRTPTPVFTFSGIGPAPSMDLPALLDPLGPESTFAELVRRDGVVVLYGAPFSPTIVHHVERASGGPPYRYDKHFPGTVTLDDGSSRHVDLLYHVRPIGPRSGHLDYDWSRLRADLIEHGVCRVHESSSGRVMAVSARGLSAYWLHRLSQDPLYLLDDESRAWVEPLLHRLGRRFELDDFEARRPLTAGTTASG